MVSVGNKNAATLLTGSLVSRPAHPPTPLDFSLLPPRPPHLTTTPQRVHLRASNASLLRVSPADISLRTPAIVLFSSSPALLAAHDNTDEGSTASDHPPAPPASKGISPGPGGVEAAPWSRLSLDRGALAINATAFANLEAPGASLRLVGRGCNGDVTGTAHAGDCSGSRGSTSGDNAGGKGLLGDLAGVAGVGLGELVADADAVLIRARSASAGVSIVADSAKPRVEGGTAAAAVAAVAERGTEAGDSGDEDRGDEEANGGGRLEVSTCFDHAVVKHLSIAASKKVQLLLFLLRCCTRPPHL